jgi:hypothetical protein
MFVVAEATSRRNVAHLFRGEAFHAIAFVAPPFKAAAFQQRRLQPAPP